MKYAKPLEMLTVEFGELTLSTKKRFTSGTSYSQKAKKTIKLALDTLASQQLMKTLRN